MDQRVIFRCSDDEKAELEAAAAARGMNLSGYIRERLLGSGEASSTVKSWEELAVIAGQVSDVETNALANRAMLAVILHLLLTKASTAEVNDLKVILGEAKRNRVPEDLLPVIIAPEIIQLLSREND